MWPIVLHSEKELMKLPWEHVAYYVEQRELLKVLICDIVPGDIIYDRFFSVVIENVPRLKTDGRVSGFSLSSCDINERGYEGWFYPEEFLYKINPNGLELPYIDETAALVNVAARKNIYLS